MIELKYSSREGFFFKLGIVGMRKTENQEVDEEAFGRSAKAEKLLNTIICQFGSELGVIVCACTHARGNYRTPFWYTTKPSI